jgi:hypothetical protein
MKKFRVADSRQGVVLQRGGLGEGLTTPHRKRNSLLREHNIDKRIWTRRLEVARTLHHTLLGQSSQGG